MADFQGDVELTNPEVTGLDESFDKIIREIPESLIQSADDHTLVPEVSKDPLRFLQDIRDHCGYIVQGKNGRYGGVCLGNTFGVDFLKPHFAVLGIEEQDAIVNDTESFINTDAYGVQSKAMHSAHGEYKGSIPTMTDGEEHDELRALYDTFLNQNTMAVRSQRLIRPICEWLIERMVSRLGQGEQVCLVRDLALPLTYKTMSTMLGVSPEHLAKFVSLGERLFSPGVDFESAMKAGDELFDFFYAQAQSRLEKPQRDTLTYLVSVTKNGERALTDSEAAIAARFILPGGIETTWRGLALIMASLLSHPEQYTDVCQDKRMIRRAVEEGFRYSPSGFVNPRLCVRDVEVAGVKIPGGAHITSFQGLTNRDPRRWEDPNTFNIHRKYLSHRTFNVGGHVCAGQHLARIKVLTCLELFVDLLPNLRLAVETDQIEYRGIAMRTPLHVPVRLQ